MAQRKKAGSRQPDLIARSKAAGRRAVLLGRDEHRQKRRIIHR